MKLAHIVTDDGPSMSVYHEGSFYDLSEITGVDLEGSGSSFYFLIEKNMQKIGEFMAEEKYSSLLDLSPRSFQLPVPHINQIRDF